MAWLSNIAVQAEDFLNRLDHNASLVLVQNDLKNNRDINISENSISTVMAPGSGVIYSSNGKTNFSAETDCLLNDGISVNTFWEDQSSPIHSIQNHHDVENKCMKMASTESDVLILDSSKVVNYLNDSSEAASKVQNRENRLEELMTKYVRSQKEIAELKTDITDYKGKNVILKSHLKQAMASLSATQEEMEKHRRKAQKLLEDKERLVEQIENSSVTSTELIEYITKLIKTRDDHLKTVDELNEKLELVQNDLATTQKQCSLFQEEVFATRQAFQKEEKSRVILEDELIHSKQDLTKVCEELKKHIILLNLKNDEIAYLQKQAESRPTSSENEELESKFHVLTKTLIMKQNSLETLTTERNALRLQLERMESDYSRVLMEINSKKTSSVLNIDNFDEGNSSFFTVSPLGEGVTRKVKRAIFSINTFNIRLGVFLRRYPVARVFLLCYMILLQIWVVVILFAYLPNSS